MNKEEFTGYLEDTSLLDAQSISSLNELISEFPYCQSARILLTLNLFIEKNIRYDSELKTTAIYVSNRGLLRKYIDKLNTNNMRAILPDDEVIDKQEPENKEEKEPKNNNEQKETPKPKPTITEDKTNNSEANFENDSESIAEVKSILERHIRELELENEKKNEKTTEAKKSTKSVKQKSDIIDDFIKNEPSISRPKTKFYNPVEKAKESIVDNENIVSETLANIFYDQGHLLKAIKIYQKLSLKFPEKSSYFAALIKKAEKELES
jgi:hypothetical protein